jgi:hypothetical protein
MRARSSRRGNSALMAGIMIVVLIGFATIVVDVGFLYMTRGQLQGAVDSGALAGARALDRQATGIVLANQRVHEYAGYHEASGSDVVISDLDISYGHWYFGDNDNCSPAPCFVELGTVGNESAINAVRVIGRRSTTTGGDIGLFFAGVLGFSQEDVTATAIAVSGGPATDCGFPMVASECELQTPSTDGICEYCMLFQSAITDNAGWTSFGTGSASNQTVAGLVRSACFNPDDSVAIDPTTNECTGSCGASAEGEEIRVNNGNYLNNQDEGICRSIQDALLRGDPNGTPQPFIVHIPVIEDDDCSDGTSYTNLQTVAGYATMEIQGANCSNNDTGVIAPGASCTPPPSGKYIIAALRCDVETNDGVVGGSYFGTQSVHVRLVD